MKPPGLSIGQLGKIISYFKDHGVTHAVMAGQVKHTQLFRNIIPDLRAAKVLAKVMNKKAESVLSTVIQEFEGEGIQFLPSTTYLEHWLCPAGLLHEAPPELGGRSGHRFRTAARAERSRPMTSGKRSS